MPQPDIHPEHVNEKLFNNNINNNNINNNNITIIIAIIINTNNTDIL